MSKLPPWLLLIVIGAIVVTFPFWAGLMVLMSGPMLDTVIGLGPLFFVAMAIRWYRKRPDRSANDLALVVVVSFLLTFPIWGILFPHIAVSIAPFILALWLLFLMALAIRWFRSRRAQSESD